MKRLSAILTLIFVSVTFLSINSSATTINVPNDYETIQEAINHSAHGNTVLVAPGTYVENINFLGRNIVVMGNPDNPNEVIIDGNNNGSVVSFCNGETDQALLTGFTIRNGSGTNGHNGHPYGGGVYVRGCSPTVSHCHINNNRAVFGAGIGAELSGGDPTISHCYISNNIAGMGGGVVIDWFSNGTIENCTIVNNTASQLGGGIYVYNSAEINVNYCLIAGNTVERENGQGGGICCTHFSNLFLTNCTISGNSSDAGAGIWLNDTEMIVVNSILWGNSSEELYYGAGLHDDNQSTFSYSDVDDDEGEIETNNRGDVTWGDGNINAYPLFVDSDNGDYHLTEDSPCIDAGDPNSPQDPDETRADMGAYYNILSAETIQFAGYNWLVRTVRGTPGWGTDEQIPVERRNLWGGRECVTLDTQGRLHLLVKKIDDVWHCAEVWIGGADYGHYRFWIEGKIDNMDPNFVFAMFLIGYDEDEDERIFRELDIEFSRWHNPDNDNGQFVVQPPEPPRTYYLGNRHQFNFDLDDDLDTFLTTHHLHWRENDDLVRFQSSGPNERLLVEGEFPSEWEYPNENTLEDPNHNPVDEGLEVYINFWLYGDNQPYIENNRDRDHEIIICNFISPIPQEVVPEPPLLVTPENGSSVTSGEVEFEWLLSPGANNYHLQIYDCNDNNNFFFNEEIGDNKRRIVPIFPNEPMDIRWRVRAKNNYDWSEWSTENEFKLNLFVDELIQILKIRCPVNCYIVDSEGQRSGYLENGDFVNDIPGVEVNKYPTYDAEGDSMTVFLIPIDLEYTIEAYGYAEGTASISIIVPNEFGARIFNIEDAEVTENSYAMMIFDPNGDSAVLENDVDGDGEHDQIIEAELVVHNIPEEMIEDLIDEIDALVEDEQLDCMQGQLLTNILRLALFYYDYGSPQYAIACLNYFCARVASLVLWGLLTEEVGEDLINEANAIMVCLGEEGDGPAGLAELLLKIEEYLPDFFALYEAYPNPFNSTTMIGYCLPFESQVTLTVYDVSGRRVATLVDGYQQPGIHSAVLGSDNLATGMYIVRLDAGGYTQTQKVMLVR